MNQGISAVFLRLSVTGAKGLVTPESYSETAHLSGEFLLSLPLL
jgi:hypothetical protein